MRKIKKINKIRVYALTLIEVMIALGLSSLIMTTMFYFYQKAARLDLEIRKVEHQVFSLRLLESQLMRIIPKSVSTTEAGRDFFFLTGMSDQISKNGTPYLLFSYDRGVDIDPLFANIVLGRLYVDKKSRLILATWPAISRWPVDKRPPPMKREVLMDNVSSIAFSFYNPPDKKKNNEIIPRRSIRGIVMEDAEVGFLKDWKNEYATLPALMKLEIETNVHGKIEKKTFLFTFPYGNRTIIYTVD